VRFRTAGVDLASQDAGTGLAEIEWLCCDGGMPADGRAATGGSRTTARVLDVSLHGSNERIVELGGRVALLGLDSPLGWPAPFHSLLAAQLTGKVDPEAVLAAMRDKSLTHRVTDHEVRRLTGLWPLSVSADKIAYPAMRAAALLAMIGRAGQPVCRSGIGSAVVECYPAAALRRWDLRMVGAKKAGGVTADLFGRLRVATPWLSWDPGVIDLCGRSHDALDAVIVALVAGACVFGRTEAPRPDQLTSAAVEGWIHLPDEDFLTRPGPA
jgi:predicted nuclease with RNAse H fold